MNSTIADRTLAYAPLLPLDKKNENEYTPEWFAQFIESEPNASDLSNIDKASQTTGRSHNEPGPPKRGTKRPVEQQHVAHDNDNQSGGSFQSPLRSKLSGDNQSGGSLQGHLGSFFDTSDAYPFEFNALDQFDNLYTFNLPEVASSIYNGVNVHGNVNNYISDSCQMIKLPVENPNIHIPGPPLPINDISSYLGSDTGGLLNDSFVGIPLNNTSQGSVTQEIPEAIPMMPILYNRHPSSAMQGSYPTNLLLPEAPQGSRPAVPTGSNIKRQRQSPSPAPPQKKIRIVHDELSMPSNFRANPNNHARFTCHSDGTREYLNAPKKRRKQHRQSLD